MIPNEVIDAMNVELNAANEKIAKLEKLKEVISPMLPTDFDPDEWCARLPKNGDNYWNPVFGETQVAHCDFAHAMLLVRKPSKYIEGDELTDEIIRMWPNCEFTDRDNWGRPQQGTIVYANADYFLDIYGIKWEHCRVLRSEVERLRKEIKQIESKETKKRGES